MTRWEEHDVAETDDARRLSRRAILRRGAVVGGTATALWAAPQLATRALGAAACSGTPLCFCGVYTLDSSCPGTWGGGSCNGGTLPSDCGGVLNCGLPSGYGFTISTTSTTVVVTLDKLDSSQCGWEFSDAWIYLDCASPACTQATLTGTPCKRTATFTYSGGVPSNIEDCFELYFKLCGCADT